MNDDSVVELIRELKDTKEKLASLERKYASLLDRHEAFRLSVTTELFGPVPDAKLFVEIAAEINALKRLASKCQNASRTTCSPYSLKRIPSTKARRPPLLF